MKIELWWIGKTADKNLENSINAYSQRIKRYTPFSIKEIRSYKTKNKHEQIKYEGLQIQQKIESHDYVILLDEAGQKKTSREFAGLIEKIQLQTYKKVIFIIGGAYGFSNELKKVSNTHLSLSSMTFPHDLVRVVFLEQLYRAFTIIKGLPYHHD